MADLNAILRRSTMLDTSGSYPAPAIQTSAIMAMGGGVFPQGGDTSNSEGNILVGRISLGIVAAFVLGAVGFYVWTNSIQGGG